MRNLKIALLSHNLSSNSLGRTFLLYQIIKRFADVKMIGLEYKNKGVWFPLRHLEDEITKVRYENRYQFFKIINKIRNSIDADLIYCVKPYIYSYGASLFTRLFKNIPLILDIDDWEWGFLRENSLNKTGTKEFTCLLNDFFNCGLFELLAPVADCITVSNRFLKNKFGGVIIPHYRDTEVFHPSVDGSSIRDKWNLPKEKKIIMFLGTERKHKGLVDLIAAFKILNTDKAALVLAGFNSSNQSGFSNKQRHRNNGENVYFIPQQPFKELPKVLSIANIIVIPQKKTRGSSGQIPAKLFDAMAMGKPIISTRVSDIPEILSEECGIVVAPDSPPSMASAIDRLLSDTKYGEQLGLNARKKAVKQYSYSAGEERLKKIIYAVVK